MRATAERWQQSVSGRRNATGCFGKSGREALVEILEIKKLLDNKVLQNLGLTEL